MRDRQTCIGCGKKSPETETNYTLISAQFGWRLTRYKDPDGTIVIEWRCPTCWRDYKKAKGADAIPPSGFAPAVADNSRTNPDPTSSQRQQARPPYQPSGLPTAMPTPTPAPELPAGAASRPSVPRPTPTSRPPKTDRSGR